MLFVGFFGFLAAQLHILGGLGKARPLGVGVHGAESGDPVVEGQLSGFNDGEVAGVVVVILLDHRLADVVERLDDAVAGLLVAARFLEGFLDALAPLLGGLVALFERSFELRVRGGPIDLIGRLLGDLAAGLHGGQAFLDEVG